MLRVHALLDGLKGLYGIDDFKVGCHGEVMFMILIHFIDTCHHFMAYRIWNDSNLRNLRRVESLSVTGFEQSQQVTWHTGMISTGYLRAVHL